METRGRPKTFNKEKIVQLAMLNFWEKGPLGVSLNEICKIAGVSKPSLYREFKDADDLLASAMNLYDQLVLNKQREIVNGKSSVSETIENLVNYATTKRSDIPLGCLYVKSKEAQKKLEPKSYKFLTGLKKKNLKAYENWIAAEQKKGKIGKSVDPKTASLYIDSQIANTLSLIDGGLKHTEARKMLFLALSVFKI